MNIVIFMAIAILIVIALIHFYWALGGKKGLNVALPTKNGKSVITPGKLLTFTVGIGLILFAYVAYILGFEHQHFIYLNYFIYAGYSICAIFILRTIGDFNVVGVFKKINDTKFALYDNRYYIPLCFLLGIVFGYLTLHA